MYMQREKLTKMTVLFLLGAIFFCVLAFWKNSYLFALLSLFFIILSIVTDGLKLQLLFRHQESAFQWIRALLLLFLLFLLISHLLKRI